MFFLIRCAFWLTIVFHAMTWPREPAGSLEDQMTKAVTGVAGDIATAAVTMASAKLEASCAKAPSACLASAARLPQIVATGQGQTGQGQPGEAASEVLPPKRPLRLAEGYSNRSISAHKALLQRN
jgi:hypothetical protein